MRGILTLVITLAVALGALGLAVASPGTPQLSASLQAAGSLGLTNSRDGETLFNASGMRPGDARSGTLRVTNTGEGPEILVLRANGMDEQPGTGGGLLSGRLALIVSDVSEAGTPVQLWAGRPDELAEARLAVLTQGETRDLVVTAALAAAGAGNAYQGAGISLGLVWGVRPESDGLDPNHTPAPTPGTTATPTRTPVPTRTPAPRRTPVPVATPKPVTPVPAATVADVSADQLGMPSAKVCLGRRKVKLRIRAPHRAPIARVSVRVGRAKATRVRGKGRRRVVAPVNLRKVRKRKATLRVEIRTTAGQRYRSARTYRICRP